MGKIVKILTVVTTVIVIAISLAWYFTAGIVDTAEQFFIAVKSGDRNKIDGYLSAEFKTSAGRQGLNEYISNNALSDYREVNWTSRSVNGNQGYLMGTMSMMNGEVFPLMLSLVKNDKGWKIYSLQKLSPGLQVALMPVQLPSEQALLKLISESTHVFANSVKEKNMQNMHRHISRLWQQQISVQQLNNAFKGFYPLGGALLKLENYRPKLLKEARLTEDGVLRLEGWYPTQPKKVFFEHQYIYENTGWKLLGFNLNIK